jgi:hypothetical protein
MFARPFFPTLRALTISLKSKSVNTKTNEACAHLDAKARLQIDTRALRCYFR